jgi:hypothetical protein
MRNKWFFVLAIVHCCFVFPCFAGKIDLERLEYEDARDIALLILEKYPQDKYTYVGIGRSLTPVVTILKSLAPGDVFVLPLSLMYYRPQKHIGYEPPLAPEIEHSLFEHFERFLPSRKKTEGKQVLLLDFVMGGGSVVATEEYLTKFATLRRPDIKLQVLIFSPSQHPDKITEAKKSYDVVCTRKYEVMNQRWMFSWFDERAEYTKFPFPFEGSDKLQVNQGGERKAFLERYQNFISADPKLNSFRSRCTPLLRKIS